MASVAGFIAEIQSSLSDEAFQTFKKALGAYKKVQYPPVVFAAGHCLKMHCLVDWLY